jgi:hypothetical protein
MDGPTFEALLGIGTTFVLVATLGLKLIDMIWRTS